MTGQSRSTATRAYAHPERILLLLSPLTALLTTGYDTRSRSQLLNERSLLSPADYACQPIGPCQPCPQDELTNPVCEIYHNRRLVDCIYLGNASSEAIDNQTQSKYEEGSDHQNRTGAGDGVTEFQTWEACERVVLKERQDFYEFVLCNVIIAAISLLVYVFRTKHLVVEQYRNLAARIGILPT